MSQDFAATVFLIGTDIAFGECVKRHACNGCSK